MPSRVNFTEIVGAESQYSENYSLLPVSSKRVALRSVYHA